MAMRELTAAARLAGLLFGSGRRHMALASRGRDPPPPTAGGQRKAIEMLWREFFSDPSQWWDHRYEKVHARYPDFKHKITKEALWLNGHFNPPWVEAEVAALAPGSLQMNLFSWNARLVRYIKKGQPEKAIELFHQMEHEGIVPDRFSFVPVLNGCASLQALEEGKHIHRRIIKSHCESNVFVSNSLIDMYAKCGSIEDAWGLFNKMPTHDVVSWNVMIKGCVKCGQGEKAFTLFAEMQQAGVEPDTVTYVGVLNACAILRALEKGRHFHEQILASGSESNLYVGTSLVDMYVECGSIIDACRVFDKMPTRNVVSWNVMILGLVTYGKGQKALELFAQMQQEGIEPDASTFVGVLNACASTGALEEGRSVHEQVNRSGWGDDFYVGSSLINMYSKCGSIDDAWRAFNEMQTCDVVACNAMILGHVKCGQGQKALDLYQQLQLQGMVPDRVTFIGALNACARVGALEEGRRIHEHIIQSGCESDIFLDNSLVDMYAKCGSIDDAWTMFKRTPVRDVVTWNAMILGHVKGGQGQKALELFQQMQQEGVQPAPNTFVHVLNACANLGSLAEGRLVHEQIIQSGCEFNVFVGNSLINMYAKCGSIENAWRVFSAMPKQDVICWNTMILGYVRCGRAQEALEIYQNMEKEGMEPVPATFVGVLNACSSLGALEAGKHVHEQIIQIGCKSDVYVCSSLIDMYAKCGSIEEAQKVFNEMPTRDVVCWNAMIFGYVTCGQGQEALELSQQMLHTGVEPIPLTFVGMLKACASVLALDEGRRVHELITKSGCESNIFVGSSLVDMYAKCGCIDDARRVFNRMPTHDVVSWNAVILGHVKCGRDQLALELYQQMVQEGVVPDPSIFTWVLKACASLTALEEGRRVHEHVMRTGCSSDVFVCRSIVDMFLRCGSMEEAQGVFDKMPTRHTVLWNALLGGYVIHGQSKKALQQFERMCQEGVETNRATFDYLLSACSHAGLVDEALHFFKSMSSIYNVSATVEHCLYVVDLLGHANRLLEAVNVIEKIPREPDATLWMALLDHCRVHGNVEVEQFVAKQILELDAATSSV